MKRRLQKKNVSRAKRRLRWWYVHERGCTVCFLCSICYQRGGQCTCDDEWLAAPLTPEEVEKLNNLDLNKSVIWE